MKKVINGRVMVEMLHREGGDLGGFMDIELEGGGSLRMIKDGVLGTGNEGQYYNHVGVVVTESNGGFYKIGDKVCMLFNEYESGLDSGRSWIEEGKAFCLVETDNIYFGIRDGRVVMDKGVVLHNTRVSRTEPKNIKGFGGVSVLGVDYMSNEEKLKLIYEADVLYVSEGEKEFKVGDVVVYTNWMASPIFGLGMRKGISGFLDGSEYYIDNKNIMFKFV